MSFKISQYVFKNRNFLVFGKNEVKLKRHINN